MRTKWPFCFYFVILQQLFNNAGGGDKVVVNLEEQSGWRKAQNAGKAEGKS